jgi:SAM-dependent methyltransferase
LCLPYPTETFDVVVSIGLLEHFADIENPIREQVRVLKPKGILLCYVVPQRTVSVQTLAIPFNFMLRLGHSLFCLLSPCCGTKVDSVETTLYRNDHAATEYVAVLRGLNLHEIGNFGMFPVPLISHSINFPFSPMIPSLERVLVRFWQLLLKSRFRGKRDPWICPERWGLAFLVWARKCRNGNTKG